MTHTKSLVVLAAAFFSFRLAAVAAPSVSGVSGTPSTGQTLQINGSGFGTKSPAAPYIWADFEGGIQPTSLGQRTSWSRVQALAASSEGYGGSRGAKATDGNGFWTLRTDFDAWTREGQRAYIFKKTRLNFLITSTSQNWKTWRMWPQDGTNYPNLYVAAHNGRAYVENIGTESGFWGNFKTGTTDWATEETIFRASSGINVKDGLITYRVNGQQKSSGSVLTRSSSAPAYMKANYVFHMVLANASQWSPGWSSNNRAWVDDVYVDTTWSRVMIGDASTFASCRNLDIQVPRTWSDGSVSIQANTKSFSSGARAYLYVFDRDNVPNSNGYPITIGQGGVAQNSAPSVNVGADRTIAFGQTLTLSPTVSDDGLPNPPARLTYAWSQVQGPGPSVIPSASSLLPGAISFPVLGQYVLRLTVSDGALSASDDVAVTVQTLNGAPTVNAGADASVLTNTALSITGTVSDDGLPLVPGQTSVTWSAVSGPGTPVFTNASALTTTVRFPTAGTYTIRLTATDGALSSSDNKVVTVTAPAVNAAPVVNAGSDRSLTLGQTLTLTPTATDDGLPNPPAALSYAWSQVLGPTAAIITNAASLIPGPVSFTAAGLYTLRLTVFDGALSSSDDISVTIQPVNVAPTVSAGADATVVAGSVLSLSGTVSDDGYPLNPGRTTVTWASIAGPGTPTISEPSALSTDARFPTAGSYTLRLTASDGALSASDTKVVTVTPAVGNVAPLVSAGTDQVVTLPAQANLAGSATDDGMPVGSQITYGWTKIAGPGNVGFADITRQDTSATFSASGIYSLQLTASDGALSSSDLVLIDVRPEVIAGGSDPAVTAVSGRLLVGGTLNISGTNFGDKSPAAPLLWADFEAGIQPSALGQQRSWGEIEHMLWSSEGFNGSRGAKAANGDGVWTMRVDNPNWTRDGQKSYIFKKQRMNFVVSANQNWKVWRMWPATFGYPNVYAAANNGRVFVENIGTESGFWGDFRQTTTNWSTEEMMMQASTAIDRKDGLLVIRHDGVEKTRGSLLTRSAAAPAQMSLNYVVHGVAANRSSWSPAWNTANRLWVDDVYVDTSWARVMIGEAATFAQCRQLEVQIPTAWSNTTVTVAARPGRFPKGTRVYLYVFDKNGRVNPNGFPMVIDTSGVGSLVDGGGSGQDGLDGPERNVFNPAKGENASLSYVLRERGSVKVIIFDRGGRRVKELSGDERLEGAHTIAWDGRNDDGSMVASGIYIAVAKGTEGSRSRQKIAVIK